MGTNGTPLAAYTWGAAGLISRRDLVTNTTYWYHFGPQGETRQVTNSFGTVVGTYVYNAYGAQTGSSGSGAGPFQYGGQFGYYTDLGGFVLCGARWYEPRLGRWLSRDPIEYEGGENLYAYCDGDPVNHVDPTGLESDGHHYVCKELYLKVKGLPQDVVKFFDSQKTGGVPGGHNFKYHGKYNKAVIELWEEWIKKRGIDVSKMTIKEASEFVTVVKTSKSSAIRGVLEHVAKQFATDLVKDGKVDQAIAKRVIDVGGKQFGKKLLKGAVKAAMAGFKKFPVVGVAVFLYTWHRGGFGEAVRDATWPFSAAF